LPPSPSRSTSIHTSPICARRTRIRLGRAACACSSGRGRAAPASRARRVREHAAWIEARGLVLGAACAVQHARRPSSR
jgi:hypothetical protein